MNVDVVGNIITKFYDIIYRTGSMSDDTDILRSYVNFLKKFDSDGLPIILTYCGKYSSCNKVSVYLKSFFKIGEILLEIPDKANYDLKFYINKFSGGELPYTYLWSYTGENVTLVSNLTDSELKFKINPGYTISDIDLTVNVLIKDSRYFEQKNTKKI